MTAAGLLVLSFVVLAGAILSLAGRAKPSEPSGTVTDGWRREDLKRLLRQP